MKAFLYRVCAIFFSHFVLYPDYRISFFIPLAFRFADYILVENFDRFSVLKHSTVEPKAFTEKGLYMLATILKSARATEATISIIETFAKLRELSRTLNNLPDASEEQQKSLLEKSGDLFTDLLDNNLQATDSETTIELNLAVLKVKHTVKRKADKE